MFTRRCAAIARAWLRCQEAGGVVNIRLVSDHETGKPKGYAFVEYEDAATALSSIRNLNGYECNGRLVREKSIWKNDNKFGSWYDMGFVSYECEH